MTISFKKLFLVACAMVFGAWMPLGTSANTTYDFTSNGQPFVGIPSPDLYTLGGVKYLLLKEMAMLSLEPVRVGLNNQGLTTKIEFECA